jgi:hypothetical protein
VLDDAVDHPAWNVDDVHLVCLRSLVREVFGGKQSAARARERGSFTARDR